jgi:hypothetical protein
VRGIPGTARDLRRGPAWRRVAPPGGARRARRPARPLGPYGPRAAPRMAPPASRRLGPGVGLPDVQARGLPCESPPWAGWVGPRADPRHTCRGMSFLPDRCFFVGYGIGCCDCAACTGTGAATARAARQWVAWYQPATSRATPSAAPECSSLDTARSSSVEHAQSHPQRP